MKGADALSANVPRETIERLEIYAGLLAKWNPRINIVAPSTVDDLWSRHIADSLQIADMATGGAWADLGSGGGFPGLVLAIALNDQPGFTMTLVESDQRKTTFLRTVIRETGISAQVIADRIEKIAPLDVKVLTARALAPLTTLLDFADRHRDPAGLCLFPKGANWQAEIAEAEATWRFHYEARPSKTNPGSVILKIGECSRG